MPAADSVKLLCCGDDFYRELSASLESASSYICFEYYSVGQDSVSTAILDILKRKAAEGVSVHAIIDDYGSRHRDFPMTDDALERYRAEGLDIAVFNRRSAFTPLPRDHRKLAVVDGVTAFVGGMNINDHNVHCSDKYGTVRDFTARLDGPVAGLLAEEFEKTWNHWSGRDALALTRPDQCPSAGGMDVSVCATSGLDGTPTVRNNYKGLIDSADSTIVLANAYLMPSAPVLRSLRTAARRGVRIDIFTSDRTDLSDLLKKRQSRVIEALSHVDNVTVHVLEDTFLHAKVISVDAARIMVGSANLDLLSRTTNLELCVLIHDKKTASLFEREMLDY